MWSEEAIEVDIFTSARAHNISTWGLGWCSLLDREEAFSQVFVVHFSQ
jgi:hypothetical protein